MKLVYELLICIFVFLCGISSIIGLYNHLHNELSVCLDDSKCETKVAIYHSAGLGIALLLTVVIRCDLGESKSDKFEGLWFIIVLFSYVFLSGYGRTSSVKIASYEVACILVLIDTFLITWARLRSVGLDILIRVAFVLIFLGYVFVV